MARVSVVIPAYRPPATLAETLAAVLGQRIDAPYEVIVVASADTQAELPPIGDDPRLKALTHVPRLAAAVARNRGVAAARGELIAFTDADVLPRPDWLAALVEASQGRLCVGGSVLNGTPGSTVGTAEYLIQFLDLHPRRPARTAWHGATCNLLVPRALWERYGPFPEDMAGGEDTLLTVRLRDAGLYRFAPRACVAHLNRTNAAAMIAHQYEFGRFTARLARRSPYKLRPLVRHWPLAPVAAAGRLVSLCARTVAWYRGGRLRALASLPIVVAGIGSWATGLLLEGIRLHRSET